MYPSLTKFKNKQTKEFDLLVKTDRDYRKSLFLVCQKFIKQEAFPDKFKETVLHRVWKRKGPAEVL